MVKWSAAFTRHELNGRAEGGGEGEGGGGGGGFEALLLSWQRKRLATLLRHLAYMQHPLSCRLVSGHMYMLCNSCMRLEST